MKVSRTYFYELQQKKINRNAPHKFGNSVRQYLDKVLHKQTHNIKLNNINILPYVSNTTRERKLLKRRSTGRITTIYTYIYDLSNHYYANNITIYTTSGTPKFIAQNHQNNLNELLTCTNKWKLRISKNKTPTILFTKRRKISLHKRITKIGNQKIVWKIQVKYFEIIPESRLSFIVHIQRKIQQIYGNQNILHPLLKQKHTGDIHHDTKLYKIMIIPIFTYLKIWNITSKINRKYLQPTQSDTRH